MNVATLNHDGTIHLVAMWYGFYEGKPAFETFTKSQKIRNLERDNRISVLMETGDEYNEAFALSQLTPGTNIIAQSILMGRMMAGTRGVLLAGGQYRDHQNHSSNQ